MPLAQLVYCSAAGETDFGLHQLPRTGVSLSSLDPSPFT